jgi:hypothetical protein
MRDRVSGAAYVEPMRVDRSTTSDEFWQGLWWLPDGAGRLRNASPAECATEIQRLRACLAELESDK